MTSIIDILLERAQENPHGKILNFLDYSTEEATVTEVTMQMVLKNALAIAQALRKKGAKKGDRVVIFSLQDPGTIYAVYGAMMAGTIFTIIPPPIDEGKTERFVSVVKSCKPKFIISNYALEQEAGNEQKTTNGQKNGTSVQPTKQLLKKAFFQTIRMQRLYTDLVTEEAGKEAVKGGQALGLGKGSREGDALGKKEVTGGQELEVLLQEVLQKGREHNLLEHIAGPNEVVYLQYTSGSTSEPKGVQVTLKNLMVHIDQVQDRYDYSTGQRLALWVPFFHNMGLLFGIFLPVSAKDGKVFFLETRQFLKKPTLWLKVLADYKAALTLAPNSAYALFPSILTPQAAAAYDLKHVQYFMSGSEFVDPATFRAFGQLFGLKDEVFASGYGMAENVCLATACLESDRNVWLDEEALRKNRFELCEPGQGKELVSLGPPIKGLTMVAVDPETGKACGENEIGEMYIQGDSVCAGYWKNPKETEHFKMQIEGYDGYFYRTGDMGVIYRGHFYMTGRSKEILVINGENVYPQDIAATLKKHIAALAADSLAFFTAAINGRETVVACVETDKTQHDFAILAARINREVARIFEFSFADIVFVKKNLLPRTDNRKIRMHKVRDLYLSGMPDVLYSSKDNAGAQKKVLDPHMALDGIYEKVKAVFDTLLEKQDYDPDAGFLELGGDSLRLVECVCRIEEEFCITLDVNKIGPNASVNAIAQYVQNHLLEGGGMGMKIDLLKECTLDESIAPRVPYDHLPADSKNVFLTGSTGFLGAFLIRSLLEKNSGEDFMVYCHVRAEHAQAGMERIVANMKHYRCWKDKFALHLQAVTGALDLPLLGMDEDVYEDLSRRIDAVYHNGAVLNFLFPYAYMKDANVEGTRECLRFACQGRPKYFHYVSSYSVYDNPSHLGKTVYENDPLVSGEGFTLGYSETKWVSEKLVQIAKGRGLKACIFRPGEITGDTVHGIWETKDLLSRLIVGSIQMKMTPRLKTRLRIVPVDYVSRAIAHISRQNDACGLAFNLLNPEAFTVRTMVKAIRHMGHKNKLVRYGIWRDALLQADIRENPLRVLASLFPEDTPEMRKRSDSLVNRFGDLQPKYDISNTTRFLKDTDIPDLLQKEDLLSVYLKYFEEQ